MRAESPQRGAENGRRRPWRTCSNAALRLTAPTQYLERAVAVLRQTEDIPDHLLAHLSPLGWEHVNLTGDYVWGAAEQMTENSDGFRGSGHW